jgi:hypothetical protein
LVWNEKWASTEDAAITNENADVSSASKKGRIAKGTFCRINYRLHANIHALQNIANMRKGSDIL